MTTSGYYLDKNYQQAEAFQALLNKVESLEHARHSAIDELKRWRDSGNPDMVRDSIDLAIRMLEEG